MKMTMNMNNETLIKLTYRLSDYIKESKKRFSGIMRLLTHCVHVVFAH